MTHELSRKKLSSVRWVTYSDSTFGSEQSMVTVWGAVTLLMIEFGVTDEVVGSFATRLWEAELEVLVICPYQFHDEQMTKLVELKDIANLEFDEIVAHLNCTNENLFVTDAGFYELLDKLDDARADVVSGLAYAKMLLDVIEEEFHSDNPILKFDTEDGTACSTFDSSRLLVSTKSLTEFASEFPKPLVKGIVKNLELELSKGKPSEKQEQLVLGIAISLLATTIGGKCFFESQEMNKSAVAKLIKHNVVDKNQSLRDQRTIVNVISYAFSVMSDEKIEVKQDPRAGTGIKAAHLNRFVQNHSNCHEKA